MAKPIEIKCEYCLTRERGAFCHLKNQKMERLCYHKVNLFYKKGEVLFREGTSSEGIFCIEEGTVKLSKLGEDGREIIMRLVKAGEILGHRSLFSGDNLRATGVALNAVRAHFIEKKILLDVFKADSNLALRLMELMSRELGDSENRIVGLTQKNVRERLASFLMMLSRSHGEQQVPGGEVMIDLKLTREDLASFVGTATETMIRMIGDFKTEGILSQRGRNIVILDLKALEKIAGEF